MIITIVPTFLKISWIANGYSLSKNLDCFFRILLGMDNPCSVECVRRLNVRLAIAGISLAALVLNSAYKNDNLLRMMADRHVTTK